MDQEKKTIDCFRNRLKQLIRVAPVLDMIHFLSDEQKEQIKAKLQNEGEIKAADLLLQEIISKTYPEGWFRELLTALERVGCKQAANYMENNPPSPSLEAENDTYTRLIDLLSLTLINMKTPDVCHKCYELHILTAEDRETILAVTRQSGNMAGARVLLSQLPKNEFGWFSQFLDALKMTEHTRLVQELQGEPDGPSESSADVDKPSLKDESELATQTETKMGEAILGSPSSRSVSSSPNLASDSSQVSVLSTSCLDATALDSSMDSSMDSSGLSSFAELSTGGTDLDLYEGNDEEIREQTTESLDQSDLDLYEGNDEEIREQTTESLDQSVNEKEIVLRDYQMDVAQPALEEKNIIICLPTGSGKTRVAVYITKQHLESRKLKGQPAKVVVLVNKVPLVEQHYKAEFGKFLKHQYSVERVSGDSQLKISFPQVVEKNDIIICTAQILENSLAKAKQGDEDGITLSQFTLMVIDECHHTQKGGVYNHIMIRYLKQKHKNAKLRKEQKDPVPLPQILGLTASPGVGGAKTQQKAEEHILRICANLDAYTIKTKTRGEEPKGPYKRIASAQERKEDPFGDVIKGIMNEIHTHAKLNPLCQPGTQNYEQWVVQKEQNAAKEDNQTVRVCAEHLRQYNEALYQSNTIRMRDAFSFLDKYYNEELKKKFTPDDEDTIQITDTERFLFKLFKAKKEHLQELMKNPQYENNSLAQLRTLILEEYTTRTEARGIIFTKTRLSAIALSQWIHENPKFEDAGVRASHLIGGGDQSVVKPMTAAEQRDVLNKFREGVINLLIATTVAEEGLDIKQCNVVIRYCLVTNEIAMIQARGRGRAEDSSYTVVEESGSGVAERESVNEYREKMMSRAITRVCNLSHEEYEKKIKENQLQAIMEQRVKMKKKDKMGMMKEDPSKVKLTCRRCDVSVCSGEDIEIIEKMHHVNVTEAFRKLFTVKENMALQERLLDYEANGIIACKKCGQHWGSLMLYKSIECPCLHIKNFVVTYNSKNKVFRKWNELPIRFPAFDYANHVVTQNSDDDTETD
ncbi:interferon-induced helicase C domain-containing protein 1 isoform X2 [Neoarius graeffei]|uniref:interferon-induced helicase C domain-containing protein 1 isoform X2 n=1 Tax=Neoarius graeffei TaxID=443677 RepID=UPI00298D3025|nr:interferon-induced helicase C domain-containing protein 1 isoform X2 [Neoarius graeffei]